MYMFNKINSVVKNFKIRISVKHYKTGHKKKNLFLLLVLLNHPSIRSFFCRVSCDMCQAWTVAWRKWLQKFQFDGFIRCVEDKDVRIPIVKVQNGFVYQGNEKKEMM
jgi:hypothetical protein